MKVLSFLVIVVTMLAECSSAQELNTDKYGGIASIEGTATGWFHLENIGGRDVLMTPDGHPFILRGIRHVGMAWSRARSQNDEWWCDA